MKAPEKQRTIFGPNLGSNKTFGQVKDGQRFSFVGGDAMHYAICIKKGKGYMMDGRFYPFHDNMAKVHVSRLGSII